MKTLGSKKSFLSTSAKIFQSLQTVITNIESFENSAQFCKFSWMVRLANISLVIGKQVQDGGSD